MSRHKAISDFSEISNIKFINNNLNIVSTKKAGKNNIKNRNNTDNQTLEITSKSEDLNIKEITYGFMNYLIGLIDES